MREVMCGHLVVLCMPWLMVSLFLMVREEEFYDVSVIRLLQFLMVDPGIHISFFSESSARQVCQVTYMYMYTCAGKILLE